VTVVCYKARTTTLSVCADDGATRAHRFRQDLAEPLLIRGQHKGTGSGSKLQWIIDPSHGLRPIGKTKLPNVLVNLIPLFPSGTLSHYKQPRVLGTAKIGESINQNAQSLPWHQVGDMNKRRWLTMA
jgi:hypothetical protein